MSVMAGVLVALTWLGAAGARQEFDGRVQAARTALVKDLEGYAAWCQSKDLFLEKQKAWEFVLTLDPEHAEARKGLGFTRAKDGTWKAAAKPKVPKNFDKGDLAEAPARLRAATAGYVGAMVALLEGGGLTPQQEERAAAEALRYDPDNAAVHRKLGDVRGEKGWVLPETARAKARREELRGFVKQALEAGPVPAPVALLEREKKIPLAMKAVATPGLRVVGTVPEEELLHAAQAVQGIERLLQLACNTDHRLPNGATVFLLADPAEKAALIDNHPAITPEQRAWYLPLEGAGIQGTADFAFWTGDESRKIDGVVRLVLGYLMSGAYEITVAQGWAYEGFGLVLTRSLVRTRMTWLAQPSAVLDAKADFALRQRLIEPETNWMDEAHQLLSSAQPPKVAELLKKSANQLTTEDVLLTYALATYLLEAQAEDVGQVLSRAGTGAGAMAVQQAVDMDLDAFELHLRRWLSERN